MMNLLQVGRPNIGDRSKLLRRINDIVDLKWLSNNGKYVQELEARVASILEVKHCIATCNATVGLEIAINALDLQGEVIIPSFTFVATAHALQRLNIKPVFCDIDPSTHNIDPTQIERLITSRTSAIMGVHLWGRGCDIQALEKIADSHGLRLLFDAAHAFGCSYEGQMIGNFGDVEVFSFHATKFINSLEGGIIATNDEKLASKIRRMINFGFTGYDCVESIGTNGKMNEFSAAMGLTNLESMSEFIDVNCRHYEQYCRELNVLPGISVMPYNKSDRNNFQYVVVDVNEAVTGISRDLIVRRLHEQGIIARRYFYPGCHRMEPYRSNDPTAGGNLAVTECLSERLMCLPTGTSLTPMDVDRVCGSIANCLSPKLP